MTCRLTEHIKQFVAGLYVSKGKIITKPICLYVPVFVFFMTMFRSGMDPLVFCTLCGVASSAVGYMLGCALYGVVWQWMNKDLAYKMNEVRHF